MSKERELLIRARDTLRGLKETHYDLYWDIQAALDQPEHIADVTDKVEPVAWRWKDKKYDCYLYLDNGAPDYPEDCESLYLAPQKREPLSKDGILELWANKPLMDLFECTRLVEKAHGIGGEE